MIEFISKLAKDVKEHLWLLESMMFSNVFNRLEESEQTFRIYILGETYFMLRQIEQSKAAVERIQKYCLSEINGTFYDDFEKRFEGSDAEVEYTSETPYKYILGVWENLPLPEVGENVSRFIETNSNLHTTLMSGFNKFFPGVLPHKINSAGEAEPSSLFECQVDDNMKAGAMMAAVEEYNSRLARIRAIATSKGNLGEILTLISK